MQASSLLRPRGHLLLGVAGSNFVRKWVSQLVFSGERRESSRSALAQTRATVGSPKEQLHVKRRSSPSASERAQPPAIDPSQLRCASSDGAAVARETLASWPSCREVSEEDAPQLPEQVAPLLQ